MTRVRWWLYRRWAGIFPVGAWKKERLTADALFGYVAVWLGMWLSLAASAATLQDLRAAVKNVAPGEICLETDPNTGALIYISAGKNGYFAHGGGNSPEETAKDFLLTYAEPFGIADMQVSLESALARKTSYGSIVRVSQRYAQYPVFGAQAVVLVGKGDTIKAVHGRLMTKPSPQTLPDVPWVPLEVALTPEEAVAAARAEVAESTAEEVFSRATPVLVVFDPRLLLLPGPIRLAYMVDLDYGLNNAEDRIRVLVDALTGEIVLRYGLIHTVQQRFVYDAGNTPADPGLLLRTEGGSPSGLAQIDNVYEFLGDTYNFFASRYGRDSIDGLGYPLSVTVRYCPPYSPCPYANAFWDGTWMYFGDGFAPDDVVAHEMVHGLTQYESGLIYIAQSGAINESLSDIWGEFVDLVNGRGNDEDAVRWLAGEDLPNGALRSLADPPQFDDPDSTCSPLWWTRSSDNYGVHTNSGVGNKLAYLLTDGGVHNGETVVGMGLDKVSALFYECQTNLLFPTATYLDLAYGLTQAALNLGWDDNERANVEAACRAVRITRETSCRLGIAPPSNDGCDSATVIPSQGRRMRGTNRQSRIQEVSLCGVNDTHAVWYSWTPTQAGIARARTCSGTNFDTTLSVYRECDPSRPLTCNDDFCGLFSEVRFQTVVGETYLIRVAGYNGAQGDFTLDVGFVPYPPNDDCAQAVEIPAEGGLITGTVVGATGTDLSACGDGDTNDVWYAWTPSVSGNAQVTACGTQFTPVVAVFTGCDGENLACYEAPCAGSSILRFAAVAGTRYLIRVSGRNQGEGAFSLRVSLLPPDNDVCSGAVEIAVAGGTVQGTLLGATGTDLTYCGSNDSNDVWYSWYSGSASRVVLSTSEQTTFNHTLALFGDCNGAALGCTVGLASRGTRLVMPVNPGTRYYIRIAGDGGGRGDFTLTVTPVTAPANDLCSDAIQIPGYGGSIDGTTRYALGDAALTVDGSDTNDVWYLWTPETSGLAYIGTCELSSQPTTLMVLSDCLSTVALAQNALACDPGAALTLPVEGDQTYLIRVAATGSLDADFRLTCLLVSPPVNDGCEDAAVLPPEGGVFYGSNMFATGAPLSLCSDSDYTDVWYRWRPGWNGTARVSLCNETPWDATLSVFDGCGGNLLVCNNDFCDLASQVTVAVDDETTYWVRVAGNRGAMGTFALAVEPVTPPINDDCGTAWLLPPEGGRVQGDLTHASGTRLSQSCSVQPGNIADPSYNDVWYAWGPDRNGIAVLDTCGRGSAGTIIEVYDTCEAETTLACAYGGCANGSRAYFPIEGGRVYYIRIAGSAGMEGSFTLSAQIVTPPINDSCSNATPIDVGGDVVEGTTRGATSDGAPCSGTDTQDVWYQWTAPADGMVKISTCGTVRTNRTTVSLWDACGGNLLACGTACYNGSSLETTVQAGASYWIRVGSALQEPGDFSLSVRPIVLPPNDDCENALELVGGQGVVRGTVAYATGSDVSRCGVNDIKDVWYRWTAPETATVQFSLCDVFSGDLVLSVFDACGGSELNCNDNYCLNRPQVVLPVSAGESYVVRVSGKGTQGGDFALLYGAVAPPDNSSCDRALIIPPEGGTQVGYTRNSNDGYFSACGNNDYNGVWYVWEPAFSGSAQISLCEGTAFDTTLAVYEGCPGTLSACNNNACGNASRLSLTVRRGTRYGIRVAGNDGAAGAFTLQVKLAAPPGNDRCTQALALPPEGGIFDGTVSGAEVDATTACTGEDLQAVWYAWTPQNSGWARISLCERTTLDTTLSVWDGCDGSRIACNDQYCGNASALVLPVQAAQTYFLRVGAVSEDKGTFQLQVETDTSCSPSPRETEGAYPMVLQRDPYCCYGTWDTRCEQIFTLLSGEGEAQPYPHSADINGDFSINLSELLRIIQFYTTGRFHCEAGSEDGYAPGRGTEACRPHDSDYAPRDWRVSLSELLRVIQIYNAGGYTACPEGLSEDGFCL